jgi:Patatin-like phospholipase
MQDASNQQCRVDPNAAVSFADMLREELNEIAKLRKKRQWESGRDTNEDCAADAACHPSHKNHLLEDQSILAASNHVGQQELDNEENAVEIFQKAHQMSLVGLAFSGGGIRSATFNLGVLQGLAELHLLPMFDYLSTVSGGGYIGSWLTAWIFRGGSETNVGCLRKTTLDDDQAPPINRVQDCLNPDRSTKIDGQEPRPIRFLREYSNYLTPRLGLFGADTWTSVAIYARNILLNQLILVLFLSSVLLLPHIAVWATQQAVALRCLPGESILAPVAVFLLMMLSLTVVTLNMKNLTGVDSGSAVHFKWYARQGWILALAAAPLIVAAWIASAWLWRHHESSWHLYHWAEVGIVAFGLTWTLASLANLPKVGPAAPHWSTTSAWLWSIVFSIISGSVGGILMRVLTHDVLLNEKYHVVGIWHVVGFGTPLVLLIFLLVGSLQIGLIGFYFPDPRREWWARLGGYLLIFSITWTAVFSIAIYSPLGLMWLTGRVRGGLGIAWVVSTLIGILGGKSSATGNPDSHSWTDTALAVTPYIFIVGVAVVIAWLLEIGLAFLNCQNIWVSEFVEGSPAAQKLGGWIISLDYFRGSGTVMPDAAVNKPATYIQAHWQIIGHESNYRLLILFVALVAICIFLSWRININEFSMNLFYRNRLVRAYLGASHIGRKPNPFTGFDPHDELQLKELRSDQCYSGPFPIVNSALNLVSGKDLAWQERKAESFVMTPLRCGFDTWLEQMSLKDEDASMKRSPEIQKYGFRPTEHYGFSDVGLRLGTAVSISGAAASPNMGYHSSPSLSFLMALFNVRLGFWAGNPRHDASWMDPGPRIGLLYLLAELFGHTDDEARYVYLSDGGHFENLGLYELVKRRCKFIIACDADSDAAYNFGDLGNAIRKCREDFGVEIEMKTSCLIPEVHSEGNKSIGLDGNSLEASSEKFSKWHWALGTIHYKFLDPSEDEGILVYLKTSITGDEPVDVLNYRREHADFPHQSTIEQWFSESQFESYRRLGQHVVEKLFQPVASDVGKVASHGRSSSEVFQKLRDHWNQGEEK